MERPGNVERDFERLTESLKAFGPVLDRLITDLLEVAEVRAHSVNHRVKRRDSTFRKLEKGSVRRSLESLTDVLGIRIITYFRDDVDVIAKVIEKEFQIDTENSVDKRAVLDPDRFGYLSVHYVAQLTRSRAAFAEYRRYSDVKFEIQIRSILQHSWAEIEHDLGYKSQAAVPRAVRRRFSRLAGLLELADDEFMALRTELSSYQKEASVTISQGRWDIAIDQDSLYSFATSSQQLQDLDEGIAKIFKRGAVRPPDRSYIGRQAEHLTSVGFNSIADVDKVLTTESDLIRSFCRNWIKDTDSPYQNAPGMSIQSGLGLYFLYLVRIAQVVAGEDGAGSEHILPLPDDYRTRLTHVLRESRIPEGRSRQKERADGSA